MWRTSISALALALASPAAAGPWAQEPGEAYLKLSLSHYDGAQPSSADGVAPLDYRALTWDLYGEVGLPARFTLVADLPYVVATNAAPNGQRFVNHTPGDARLELQQHPFARWPIAVALAAKVPLYSPVAETATEGLVDVDGRPWPATSFPEVGDGNLDLTPKLLLGQSLYPLPAWLTAEVGYRVRLDGYADGVAGAFGGGAFVFRDNLALGANLSGVLNVESGDRATREYAHVSGYVLLTGLALAPGIGLQLGAGRVVWARHAGEGQDLSFGISHPL